MDNKAVQARMKGAFLKGNTLHKTQQGFVLVAVLWVIVILIMAASAFSVRVDNMRELAEERQKQSLFQIQSNDMLAKIVYTVMTGKKSPSGVPWPSENQVDSKSQPGFTSLDDFLSGAAPVVIAHTTSGFLALKDDVMDIGGGMRMIVQDRAGLIGFPLLKSSKLLADIGSVGAKAVSADVLRAALVDYQDADEYRSTYGAEKKDYQSLGMAEPFNGFLRTPLQIRQVIGWQSALSNVTDGWILRYFRVDGGDGVNINTAPAQVLSWLFPSSTSVEKIVENREVEVFKSIFDMNRYLGVQEDYPFIVSPASGVRVWMWREGFPSATVYDVQFESQKAGLKSWALNWKTRVKLPDELANLPAKKIDHPFFQ